MAKRLKGHAVTFQDLKGGEKKLEILVQYRKKELVDLHVKNFQPI